MWDYLKLAGLGLVAVLAAIAANYGHDLAYQVNAIEVMLAAGIAFLWVLRSAGDPKPELRHEYLDGVIRAGEPQHHRGGRGPEDGADAEVAECTEGGENGWHGQPHGQRAESRVDEFHGSDPVDPPAPPFGNRPPTA